MSFLNDLKKVFFGIESASKSAMRETKEAASKASENLVDKTSGLKDAILEKADETIENIKTSETVHNASSSLDSMSEKIQHTASDFADKAADVSEKIGTTVFGEDNETLDKAKEFTEEVGKKVIEAKDKLIDKAEEIKAEIDKKIDETIIKAKEDEAKDKFEKENRASTPPSDHGDSTLDDKDDFFSKAEKYADGDYTAFTEGNITIDKSGQTKPKSESKAAGFEDLDGDGNEIVDDAIIEQSSDDDTSDTPSGES